jgi:hypothetical protein
MWLRPAHLAAPQYNFFNFANMRLHQVRNVIPSVTETILLIRPG